MDVVRKLLGVVPLLVGAWVGLILPAFASADPQTTTFNYTGAAQTWTVPYGVSSATFELNGAQGRGFPYPASSRPGLGGWSKASFAVTPNTQYTIMVGGQGVANGGGFNGGGSGGYGGGGATDVRSVGTALTDRILVAAGGGGGGFSCLSFYTFAAGGGGGGLTGYDGSNTNCSPSGTGASQTGGGSPGGVLGKGGDGGPSGGGGGYYGGGGSVAGYGNGGPGGGGSSYGPPGFLTAAGVRSGDGVATVTYEVTSTRRLQASAVGYGDGYITSSPAGVDCGTGETTGHDACFYDFGENQPVVVTAHPAPGTVFDQWIAGCTGSTQLTCSTTMSSIRTISARFHYGPRQLAVSKPGNGAGNVISDLAGISCGATCSADYPYDTEIILTATPDTGSDFTGWGGPCSGTGPCTVTMNQVQNVSAIFTLEKRGLYIEREGPGDGAILSDPAGINCSATSNQCEIQADYGTTYTVTATPDNNSTFVEWDDECDMSTSVSCTMIMNQDRGPRAVFALKKRDLTITTGSAGGQAGGTVGRNPAGSDCGAGCFSYDHGTSVTVTATPDSKSEFDHWAGFCTGDAVACTLGMDQDKQAEAVFRLQKRNLDLALAGNGGGTVTSDPAGLGCGSICSASFDIDSEVTLTAEPDAGSGFAGWTGACAGTGPTCSVTMDEAKNVEATFTLVKRQIAANIVGGGGVEIVSGSGEPVICDKDCVLEFDHGSDVALTATADPKWEFQGWTGQCSGNPERCELTASRDLGATATFVPQRRELSVSLTGSGRGSVTSDPAGIDCGNACHASFEIDTAITLVPNPAPGSKFEGWVGACAGTGSCAVTLDQARSLTADFSDLPPRIDRLEIKPKKVKLNGKARKSMRRHGPTVTLSVSEESTIGLRLLQKGRKARTFRVEANEGASRIVIPRRVRRNIVPGRYTLVAVAIDGAGQSSDPRRVSARVIRARR